MAPAIATGDVVGSRAIRAADARLGDVVIFRHPEDRHRLITHRVLSIRVADGTVSFVTKGDANHGSVERWSLPADGKLGRVIFRIPKLGYGLAWFGGRWSRFALLLPVLLMAGWELRRIWRDGDE
jgi:signal peptidase